MITTSMQLKAKIRNLSGGDNDRALVSLLLHGLYPFSRSSINVEVVELSLTRHYIKQFESIPHESILRIMKYHEYRRSNNTSKKTIPKDSETIRAYPSSRVGPCFRFLIYYL